uniref:14 kDa phosphohistidine phosphatase n=1 Tax=Plectus sambesii TaxID=2011161 RepID=A0A914V6T3_9BILA
MDSVENVDIDGSGKFKYILIKVTDKTGKDSKFIVRGYGRCEFHDKIMEEVTSALGDKYTLDCVGGGKIVHHPDKKQLAVFGESQGFGQADHAKSIEILKKRYPDYSFSQEEAKE